MSFITKYLGTSSLVVRVCGRPDLGGRADPNLGPEGARGRLCRPPSPGVRRVVSTQRGFTLIELLVTLSVSAALMGIVAANLSAYNRSSKNAVSMVQGFFKQARAKGISRTAAYRVYAESSGKRILTSFANTCASATFTPDTSLVLEMPQGTTLLSPTWNVCFSARGLATTNVTVPIKTTDAGTKTIEVLLGGGTREL